MLGSSYKGIIVVVEPKGTHFLVWDLTGWNSSLNSKGHLNPVNGETHAWVEYIPMITTPLMEEYKRMGIQREKGVGIFFRGEKHKRKRETFLTRIGKR